MHTVNDPRLGTPRAPLSHAVVHGDTVYCSGQLPLRPDGTMLEGGAAELTTCVLRNLEAVLKASGSSLDLVLRATIYLVDLDDFAEVNRAYAELLPHAPARTCIQVAALPLGGRVEIDCIAEVGDGEGTRVSP